MAESIGSQGLEPEQQREGYIEPTTDTSDEGYEGVMSLTSKGFDKHLLMNQVL